MLRLFFFSDTAAMANWECGVYSFFFTACLRVVVKGLLH